MYFATTIHDRVYLINAKYEAVRITIEGETLMRELAARGSGALLMGAHMGSFEVIGSAGRRRPGLQVSMAMYEDNARKINSILAAINPEAMPDIISLGHLDAMLKIAERFRVYHRSASFRVVRNKASMEMLTKYPTSERNTEPPTVGLKWPISDRLMTKSSKGRGNR